MIGELLLAVGAFLWLLVLLIYLAMRAYIALRKAIFDRRVDALLRRYEEVHHGSERILPSTQIRVTRTKAIEKEPPGEVILELDLTKKD